MRDPVFSNLVPSGRFAQLARLSRKALRIYAEMGLLRPAHVNPETNYRYYSLSQLEDAHRINKLRELGMSLESIREMLRVWGTPEFAEQLGQHREELLRQASAVQTALENVEHLLSVPARSYTVYTKHVSSQRYLGTRAWCDPDDSCDFISKAQQTLLHVAKESLLGLAGSALTRYHEDERDDCWEVEVCLPVAGHTPIDLPKEIYSSELPSGTVAFTVHAGDCGGDRGMQDAYKAVWSWLHEHGHETLGGPIEVYVFDETNTENPADFRTEVAWMIR
jgi:DNA-binding transcriptional MerR regulator/effector-binding domain-containing protein